MNFKLVLERNLLVRELELEWVFFWLIRSLVTTTLGRYTATNHLTWIEALLDNPKEFKNENATDFT